MLFIDIPMRAFTAVTEVETLCLVRAEVWRHYISKWLIIDIFSTIPFSIMLKDIVSEDLRRWLLTLRLLKLFRILEMS